METAAGILCCAFALALGFHAGWHWASGAGWAVLVGLLAGAVCVGLYVVVTSWIGLIWPNLLDPHVVGLHLILVGMAAPVCGALGSLLSYRRSLGRRMF